MKIVFGLVGCLIFVLLFLTFPVNSWRLQSLNLDGKFDDWQERAFLADDQVGAFSNKDIKTIFWSTNVNEQKLYFMVERYVPKEADSVLTCRVYFDINNNGNYEDSIDKYAEVTYNPDKDDSGEVVVRLYSVAGKQLATYQGAWGEGRYDGGKRFEFAIPMSDLNLYPAQPIRFFFSSVGSKADRLPNQGDILWSPFPIITKSSLSIAIGFSFWLVVTLFFRRHRIWIFYYVWGAVGFTFIVILLLRGSFLEHLLEHQAGIILHYLLSYFDIKTSVFDNVPSTLLLLTDVDSSWTTIEIDIENSGLLEMCILLGLLLFYPAYNPLKKLLYSMTAISFVYLINLLRLLIVITTIHWCGRNMIFIAHTLLGRLVFFILIIALYWHLFTRPSLRIVKEYVEND